MKVTELTIAMFEASALSEEVFTHEAHVFMGWLYIQEFGADEGLVRFDAALRRLVKVLGAEAIYSAMTTWLFMKLIAARMQPGQGWSEFRQSNGDLFEGRPKSS